MSALDYLKTKIKKQDILSINETIQKYLKLLHIFFLDQFEKICDQNRLEKAMCNI